MAKAPRTPLDLAMQHVMRHPNDRSLAILARLRRAVGRTRAKELVLQAAETKTLIDPEYAKKLAMLKERDNRYHELKIPHCIEEFA